MTANETILMCFYCIKLLNTDILIISNLLDQLTRKILQSYTKCLENIDPKKGVEIVL